MIMKSMVIIWDSYYVFMQDGGNFPRRTLPACARVADRRRAAAARLLRKLQSPAYMAQRRHLSHNLLTNAAYLYHGLLFPLHKL